MMTGLHLIEERPSRGPGPYLWPVVVVLGAWSIGRLTLGSSEGPRPTTQYETPQQILDRRAAAGEFDADTPSRAA